MSLKKLLFILSGTTAAVMLLSGSVLLWVITEQLNASIKSSFQSIANSVASTVGDDLKRKTQTVDRIGAALFSGSPNDLENLSQLQELAEKETRFLPGLLKIRILPLDIEEPDQSSKPHMGYADLVMVKNAIDSNPKPALHGFGTPHAHLAIARKIVVDNRVVGIVLASFSRDKIGKLISGIGSQGGAFELIQGELSIGFSGMESFKASPPTASIDVGISNWKIRYWVPTDTGFGVPEFYGIICAVILLLAGLHYYGFRWITRSIKYDQSSIVKVVSDLVSGKVHGAYPMKIKELENIITMLSRLKRLKLKDFLAMAEDSENAGRDTTSISPPNVKKVAKTKSDISTTLPKDIFRAYDIRGVVGKSLTTDLLTDIGLALGSEAEKSQEQTIIVAYDGRLSSPDLCGALVEGLQESGRNVINIGLVPTPLLYFATHFLESNSGIMITGSHNPPDYNGVKMVIAGESLCGERIEALYQRIESRTFITGNGSLETRDLTSEYVGTIVDDIQIDRPMKIVVDCGNGVAGKLAPLVLRSIGCDVVELYCEIDGNFPNHHPNPSKLENLEMLMQSVRNENADLGLAFDGDGDRLGVVDGDGNIIWPDRLMMLFAANVLSRHPGADIIFDVKCSKHLASEIVKHGGRPVMWKTGHSLIKAKIRETGAQLAGEMSGHIFFKDRWFGFDDAIYSAARLLEILSADSRSATEVFAELPNSVNTPELNVALTEGENFTFIEKLLSRADFDGARVTTIDGLRADFPHGWGLVRASNTTPSLVLRFEADNEQALREIQEKFRKTMLEIKPEMALPF